ncbi:MAG: Uma2 family endonuclease [Microcystis aeruginosa K13-06]|nr:Uma2 family endonuclease [Microcystis aeruginosa K13-06]
MVVTKEKLYTFAEYLNYQDCTDDKYELFNGELISMPPASGFHSLILRYIFKVLEREIERLQLDWQVMPATVGIRTDKAKSRIPDLMILTAEQCQEIRNMTTAVIDPIALKISVLNLISGFYELAEFNNEDRIISVTFPDLQLTPQMVFAQ